MTSLICALNVFIVGCYDGFIVYVMVIVDWFFMINVYESGIVVVGVGVRLLMMIGFLFEFRYLLFVFRVVFVKVDLFVVCMLLILSCNV